MKVKLQNPFGDVKKTGGATFEPSRGWWSQAGEESHYSLGANFESQRDALYIPTIQKNGEPVDRDVVEYLKGQAQKLGLNKLTQAAGMWVLSETGEVQTETVWIAYCNCITDKSELANLALEVKDLANQDAVAWEEQGQLKFKDFILYLAAAKEVIIPTLMSSDRVWIVPQANLETIEVRELLANHGEKVFLTNQPWGASWAGIEEDILEEVKNLQNIEVYGVKLVGDTPEEFNSVTVSRYQGEGLTPLEQVAQILKVELSEYQKLTIVNLKGRVQSMSKAGVKQGIIDAVRLADRSRVDEDR